MSPVRTLGASLPFYWFSGPVGTILCVCVFQKTVATMGPVALGGKCGEKANGDPASCDGERP